MENQEPDKSNEPVPNDALAPADAPAAGDAPASSLSEEAFPNETPVPFGNNVPKPERDWAMFSHLSGLAGYIFSVGYLNFLGPLIIWLIKREEMPFVNDQGKESLNFQITILLLLLICLPLCFVFIGFVLLPLVWLFGAVFTVIAGLKAQEGVPYRYPFAIRLIP